MVPFIQGSDFISVFIKGFQKHFDLYSQEKKTFPPLEGVKGEENILIPPPCPLNEGERFL